MSSVTLSQTARTPMSSAVRHVATRLRRRGHGYVSGDNPRAGHRAGTTMPSVMGVATMARILLCSLCDGELTDHCHHDCGWLVCTSKACDAWIYDVDRGTLMHRSGAVEAL